MDKRAGTHKEGCETEEELIAVAGQWHAANVNGSDGALSAKQQLNASCRLQLPPVAKVNGPKPKAEIQERVLPLSAQSPWQVQIKPGVVGGGALPGSYHRWYNKRVDQFIDGGRRRAAAAVGEEEEDDNSEDDG
ncbi:hypothetical protein CEUSTIGMA_g8120.t1 [Chlamydomonas eustigma]|uniref:Uncharacterized protein n=1 Tax=Chlamydomonas eustigma TaxID=1157962 RepID=A0A250XC69_9CHLO|nr:hypothetical protein CEUSTIGMA_g8120.t1 [Chlamydomonas eustigma]|eukprot:GAX80685.1 hypothetical protein CEUSTIGMA_g8120.t1 [Chlamydomonas eustigma]